LFVEFVKSSFQSHPGSISTRVRLELRPLSRGFNPTLVRLAPEGGACSGARDKRFNPTLVRLAHRTLPHCTPTERCFNPTLVRLARVWVQMGRSTPPVSIPPWFD